MLYNVTICDMQHVTIINPLDLVAQLPNRRIPVLVVPTGHWTHPFPSATPIASTETAIFTMTYCMTFYVSHFECKFFHRSQAPLIPVYKELENLHKISGHPRD
jgi:hypothetical protein